MANFLHYSDYKKFIEDLVQVPDVVIVAQLMDDFDSIYSKDNPTFYTIFLNVLLSIYPNFSLECEEELLIAYDEEKFKHYPNPRLEYVGQYMFYLSSKCNDGNKPSDIERVPYDFEDEARHVIDKVAVYGYDFPDPKPESNGDKNSTEGKKEKPYTFGIRELHKESIKKIIENINEDITISGDESIAQTIANILTCRDLALLSEKNRSVRIICKTNFFVFLLDEIRISFGGKISERFLEKALFYTTTGKPLTIQNIYTSRSRNNDLTPKEADIIKGAIKRYSLRIDLIFIIKCKKRKILTLVLHTLRFPPVIYAFFVLLNRN
jgi:hypothetical protein